MDNNESKPQQTGGLKLMTVFIAVLALHVLVIGGFTVYHLMSSGGDADLTLDKNHKLRADGTLVTDTTTPDATTPDKSADSTASTDTATTPSTPATTGTATAAATPAPATDAATTETATPPAAPAPAPAQVAANTPAAPAPATTGTATSSAPIVLSGDDMSQTSTIPPGLAPPPDASQAPLVEQAPASTTPVVVQNVAPVMTPAPSTLSSNAPSGPIAPAGQLASGPVHMPANQHAPSATTNVVSNGQHVTTPAHEEHAVASTHETKKQTYTVKITDSYKKIAEAHHITVAELKAANHIKGDVLHTGQKLIIPASKTSVAKSGTSHEPSASETASLSASPTGTAKSHRHYYTVAKGDTLKKIAKKFDVTASALEEANDLNGTKVAVGEKLRIPSHETHNTASTGTASASFTDHVAAPVEAPAPIQPSQVENQPAPVEQPAPTPVATPAPEPQPTPASSPELTSLNF